MDIKFYDGSLKGGYPFNNSYISIPIPQRSKLNIINSFINKYKNKNIIFK